MNTNGKATTIKATVYKDPLIDERTGVQQIAVSLVDSAGQTVYDAENAITVSITGSATLLGIENSDANYVGDYHSGTRKAKHGVLIVYVQPAEKNKAYEITLESPGLKPVAVKYN